ncbi:DUF3284 domain-containing protein [Candidatus Stoquefichus massiliensis]|uniref:DUF3284 domain-containing protein n=1 Tax=Candidatus Stoquefichus massiliensis TaxID=1470350 RepID=UPI000484F27A|nr:DUF3284 domain-containing protein [Candidatus Stoquefichus massiliensis]
MKKEKIVLKCIQEEFYNAVIQDFKNQYKSVKNKDLKDEDIVKGFSFSTKLPMKKHQTVVNKATYKVLECEFPKIFVMEYKSKTYHKVISAEMKELDDGHMEVLFGSFDEKLKDGVNPTKNFGEDEIVNAKFMTKRTINSMLKNYRKSVQEIQED